VCNRSRLQGATFPFRSSSFGLRLSPDRGRSKRGRVRRIQASDRSSRPLSTPSLTDFSVSGRRRKASAQRTLPKPLDPACVSIIFLIMRILPRSSGILSMAVSNGTGTSSTTLKGRSSDTRCAPPAYWYNGSRCQIWRLRSCIGAGGTAKTLRHRHAALCAWGADGFEASSRWRR
jgi:hypothetical protein